MLIGIGIIFLGIGLYILGYDNGVNDRLKYWK